MEYLIGAVTAEVEAARADIHVVEIGEARRQNRPLKAMHCLTEMSATVLSVRGSELVNIINDPGEEGITIVAYGMLPGDRVHVRADTAVGASLQPADTGIEGSRTASTRCQ
jgi:hypothetical protein